MAGYTRQSAADIVDGANILAVHFNDEFDQLEAAFSSNAGHTHDGTAGNGGAIGALGEAGQNQIQIATTSFGPATTNNFIDIQNFRTIKAVDSFELHVGLFKATYNELYLGSGNTINASSDGHTLGETIFDGGSVSIGGSSNAVNVTSNNFNYNVTNGSFTVNCNTFTLSGSSNSNSSINNVAIGTSGAKSGNFTTVTLSGGASSKLQLPTNGLGIEFTNEIKIDRSTSQRLRITNNSQNPEFLFNLNNSDPWFESAGNIVLGNSQDSFRYIEWGDGSTPAKMRYNSSQNYWEFYFSGSSNLSFAIGKDFNNNPKVYFGNPSSSGPYLWYDSSNNKFKFNVSNQDKWSLDNSGNLRIQGYLYENQFNV
jgi:hypothetical protein